MGLGRLLPLAAMIALGGNAQAQQVVEAGQINYLTGDPATWPSELEATVAAPDNHRVLLENDHVRVLEVTLGPGEVEPLHFHRWPSVLHILQADQWIDRDADGKVIFDSREAPPIQYPLTMWKGPEAPHSPVNLSDSVSIRLIRVEVKPDQNASAQPDALTDFARRYAAAWSSQKPEAVAAFYAEDGRLVVNDGEPAVGRAAIADVARGFMEAFPDMVVGFDRLGESDGRRTFHWTLTGTNTGPGGTGARVLISGVEAWAIGPDGLIADSNGSFDAADYAWQLGTGGSEDITDLTPVLDNRTRVIIDGIRSGDVSGIMALYQPSSLYAADSATLLSDPEAIRAFWVDVAASPAHDATLEVLRIERLGPDAFVEIQKYDVLDEAGARLFGGYASLLWRKVGGRWVIAADVSN